jgi:hypothetical protein
MQLDPVLYDGAAREPVSNRAAGVHATVSWRFNESAGEGDEQAARAAEDATGVGNHLPV